LIGSIGKKTGILHRCRVGQRASGTPEDGARRSAARAWRLARYQTIETKASFWYSAGDRLLCGIQPPYDGQGATQHQDARPV